MPEVGDRVLLLAMLVPGTGHPIPADTIGTITRLDTTGYWIAYRDNAARTFWFGPEDFSTVPPPPFLQPEFDLDDMERGEKIIEELSK